MELNAQIKNTKYNSDRSQNEANKVAQIPATNPLNSFSFEIHKNKLVHHHLVKN